MARKNRKTLKEYFKQGSLPSQQQFDDLIDSTLNTIDEGFSKSPDNGLEVAQLDNSGKLISFYQNIAVENPPLWSIKVDPDSNKLIYDSNKKRNLLSFMPEGRVGVNTERPEVELDVDGTVASTGRRGRKKVRIAADGQWHEIENGLQGCNAFEIMAGVGKPKSGKYALLHAFALKTFNSKGNITEHQANYGSRCNRLRLCWEDQGDCYALKLRSNCSYEVASDPVFIQCYITRLWFDTRMEGCSDDTSGDTG